MVRAADNPPETETDKKPKEEGPRSFNVFLRKLADGEAETTLSAELFELGRKLQEDARFRNSKSKGKLKLAIAFTASPDGTVEVHYDVTVTAPKPARSMATFWLTKGGNLSHEPTKQQKLPFQDVANERGMPRDLGGDDEPAPREV